MLCLFSITVLILQMIQVIALHSTLKFAFVLDGET